MLTRLTKFFKTNSPRNSKTKSHPQLVGDVWVLIMTFIEDESLIRTLHLFKSLRLIDDSMMAYVLRSRKNLLAVEKGDFEFVCKIVNGNMRNLESENCKYLKVDNLEKMPLGGAKLMAQCTGLELRNIYCLSKDDIWNLLNPDSHIQHLTISYCKLVEEPSLIAHDVRKSLILSPNLKSITTQGPCILYDTIRSLQVDLEQRFGKKLKLIFKNSILELEENRLIEKLQSCITCLALNFSNATIRYSAEKMHLNHIHQFSSVAADCRTLVIEEMDFSECKVFRNAKKLCLKDIKGEMSMTQIMAMVAHFFPSLEHLAISECFARFTNGENIDINFQSLNSIQVLHSHYGSNADSGFLKYVLENSFPLVEVSFKLDKSFHLYARPRSDMLSLIFRKIDKMESDFNSDPLLKEYVSDLKQQFIHVYSNPDDEEKLAELIENVNSESFLDFILPDVRAVQERRLNEIKQYIQNYQDLVGEDEIHLETVEILKKADSALLLNSHSEFSNRLTELESQLKVMVNALEDVGFSSKLLFCNDSFLESEYLPDEEEMEFDVDSDEE
ncbi:predicted protein [Naegleria gruberi]|uniref:Predicted protein n=1 Tax=Naegleria gruberi TaxID=5762 RepID=D2VQG4_NAEGR|nr:uncharacterized protein NAEGRDRAFT_71217 [Naegleria gruberi]EFC40942.1 predicted protein [Naegleria gruberi]|eukprot:XP_002673686.1 predicted protein [Naegleria gruberi strain NEG-M]